jgi:peptidyl-prolyl cis-trans isomerase B (cyclophilin B)
MIVLHTSVGDISLELDFENAPLSAANFLQYAEEGHYDGTIFHRVIDNFMVQGGGFEPGMKQKPVKAAVENEAANGLKNDIGSIAMARTMDPHSATAQFFINIADNHFLNHTDKTSQGWGYTVFGKVTDGMDIVDKIKKCATGSGGGHQDVPVEDIVIETVTIDASTVQQPPVDAPTSTDTNELYILGDFFNLWIGDDNITDLSNTISDSLTQLATKGCEIYLMHGNRDFLIGKQFSQQCSASLLTEPYLLQLCTKQYLLMHGDALCTKDTDYMQFRNMVRDPQWQLEFLDKPLVARQEFANQARAHSQHMVSNKAADIMDVTDAEVLKIMRDNNVSTLIHGHTHRPAIHDLSELDDTARRIVLGDWDEQAWYLKISDEVAELIHYPLTSL